MMKHAGSWFLALLLALLVSLGSCNLAEAANKKAKAPAPPPKEIYLAPMTVVLVRYGGASCEPDCPEWIAAEGEITDATPAKFRAVFKQMGKKKLPIIIRSPGGSINAALEIGRMIRKRKLDVGVGATQFTGCAPNDKACKLPKEQKGVYRGIAGPSFAFCNSACPLILAAGIVRLASRETSIGVHKPKTESWREYISYRDTYRIVKGKKKIIKHEITGRKRVKGPTSFEYSKSLKKKLKAYYVEMGVNPAIIDESEKAAFKTLFTLRREQLDALKLRTSDKTVGVLTDWIICRREPKAVNCVKGDLPPAADHKLAALRVFKQVQGIKPEDQPMQFVVARYFGHSCEPSCPEWISGKGIITAKTPQDFEAFLAGAGKGQRNLVIDSLGGDLDGSLAFGQLVRKHKFNVAAASTEFFGCKPGETGCKPSGSGGIYKGLLLNHANSCAGTCFLVLAGGVERLALSVQVPALSWFASERSSQAPAVLIHAYLGGLGHKPDFMQMLRDVSVGHAKDFAMPALFDAGILTTRAWPYEFANKNKCRLAATMVTCITR